MTHPSSAAEAFARLVGLVHDLRAPGGCPWDRAQTLQTLRPFVLEETYEVLEAIDRNDLAALREELGDFLFEGVLLAQVCNEAGAFDVADSLHAISDKLVRRHPHVFAPREPDPGLDHLPRPDTPDAVVSRWEAVKARETGTSGTPRTTLGGVPASLPSLLRAHELGTRASAVGFDWDRAADVLAKIEEEVAELREAVESSPPGATSRIEDEMGDLFFALANLARKLGVEPESALRIANDKFTRRFTAMETAIRESGRSLQVCSLQDLEDEWEKAKAHERSQAGNRSEPDTDARPISALPDRSSGRTGDP